MSDPRAGLLASVRRALRGDRRDLLRRGAIASRLAERPHGPLPRRAVSGDPSEVFEAEARGADTTLVRVPSSSHVPAEVAGYLSRHGLPATVRIGSDPFIAALPWATAEIAVIAAPVAGDELCAVSNAFAAVAETGSLVLTSGPENPTVLNFLPDHHIIVLHADNILPSAEFAFKRLRQAGAMPRTVNIITGPSRSADIEQTLLLGAHGPKRLHLILIKAQ
jgi:L-lactate dehydrogenase complex protein LldG